MNDFLTGSNDNLSTVIDRIADKVEGLTQRGNSLVLTVDMAAQRVAMEQLADVCGAAVALEPATGRVLAIASSPTYDQNLVEDDFGRILSQQGPCRPAAPLLNRASAGPLHPRLDLQGRHCRSRARVRRLHAGERVRRQGLLRRSTARESSTSPIRKARRCSGASRSPRRSSTRSTPCSATSARSSARSRYSSTAERFGFYEKPPLETPSDEREASGLYRRGELYLPSNPNDVDPGRLAFGQERLLVTPFQMAMVAAGVANGGSVMRPFVVDRILKPDGSILTKTVTDEYSQAVSPDDRGRPDRHDGARRGVGHGHCGSDPWHPRRRQDRDGRDRARGPERRLVHRLRARPTTRRWRSPSPCPIRPRPVAPSPRRSREPSWRPCSGMSRSLLSE